MRMIKVANAFGILPTVLAKLAWSWVKAAMHLTITILSKRRPPI
jgi:hypothetical protein